MFRVYVTALRDGEMGTTELHRFNSAAEMAEVIDRALFDGSIATVWHGRKCVGLYGA